MTTLINGALPQPKQIRFVNNQGQPPSKRRRINAACLTCRKRKTRCAGEKPVCSTCTKNGHVCLGYNEFAEKKKEDGVGVGGAAGGATAAASRGDRDRGDTTDLSNDPDEEYIKDEEEDDRRHYKVKAGGRTASFVDHGDATSGRDSVSSNTETAGRQRGHSNDWDQETRSQASGKAVRRSNLTRNNSSYSDDGRSSNNRSPVQQHTESHRVPYFRYFGPTAIVPGYKQMVVNVSVHRDRRRSRGGSFAAVSPGSLFGQVGHGVTYSHVSHPETVLEPLEEMPMYNTDDPAPVHQVIISLINTFFLHLGCNYPFLREERVLRMVKEKSLEPILVDSMCALAARFSDLPIFTNERDGKSTRSEYGHVFAGRAKAATVDTFPCPSVAAVQACLLMAYEGFGANQDSALWMYLGLAIRMAVDLGLQKEVGVQYQGERDPWYTRTWSRKSNDVDTSECKDNDEETLSPEEQREVVQERIDTFWAVFILDRVISSGTGRPVTFRDDDFDLQLPAPSFDPVSGWPAPLPTFIQIIHLYGRVSDVLNNIRDAADLDDRKMTKLKQMESDLTEIYQQQDPRLHFNAHNFQEYVRLGQGTTFILLHFWFHALIVVLHQPALLTPFGSLNRTRLLENSRELARSSAKTIADILSFAELIDPKSFIGNPFTSQPMYIAACALLLESVANASESPSPEASPPPHSKDNAHKPNPAKHSLLASAANQNYQKCYKSLQQLQQYWGGVGYILTALDQKSKGIWDCETFTSEEYESTKLPRRESMAHLPVSAASPNVPPIGLSLTGTTNSPNSNLTLLYQSSHSAVVAAPPLGPPPPPPPRSGPVSAATPPGNMVFDPVREPVRSSFPDTSASFPPAYPQPNVSAVRYQVHPPRSKRHSMSSVAGMPGKSFLEYETFRAGDDDEEGMDPDNSPGDSKMHVFAGISQVHHGRSLPPPPSYTPSPHNSSGYEGSVIHDASPSSSLNDLNMGQHHSSHHQQQQHHHQHSNGHHVNGVNHNGGGGMHGPYDPGFSQSGLVSGSYSYMSLNPISDITFDSQEINMDALGLDNGPWLEMLPGDVLNLFEGGMTGGHHGHMG
ncbi:fungal-specific transcription factor domain-containing protein [Diplogelasinospora grovesii]|uniref:Fungal-specific transcription factor domain-containing protein n=1 Tax=Diplogelasinospora grovesii TaxID=303347 RepID=A0AAN6SB37_9PEZI|nr:fungal-specific transcription factor domain-containing protein [Diplogelasinospora grovesii]